ncbi:MFS transporter [Mucilaginibacter sp. CAU 1740]|uniref:MFS transporter n=1 Tax=Mucilaginibacter sp. CAU 1740 TaxID=3140365 RepID=UPI00325BB256
MNQQPTSANPIRRILTASLIGTTIEFFDFYIYATAAVLVFPKLFFSASDPASATLESLATFALAFFARPLGAAIFGHFGDRKGRKATLVAALMTMGPSTVAIGLLPGYNTIGIAAPILLALFRFGQGLGLGGEWGGAVLLATENAPPHKKAWYGMFPQLGAPIGFLISSGTFFILSKTMSDEAFISYGWRIPFIASALLVWVGLYVRLKISETPDFVKIIDNNERSEVPFADVFVKHTKAITLGTLATITTFLLFYLMTVFTLNWGTTALHYTKSNFLIIQMISMLFFGLGIPLSAVLADKYGRDKMLILATICIMAFGLVFAPLFTSGSLVTTCVFLSLGMFLMGLTYGPIGTALAGIFPASVRYTGASLAFTLAGILGASITPALATKLAGKYGLAYVGYYLTFASAVTLLALLASRKMIGKQAE